MVQYVDVVMTTRGDLVTGNASGNAQRLAVGSANTVLKSDGTDPAWGSVALANLASGIAPSHVVKFAGSFTTAGGDADESITVTGAAATDIAIVTLHTKGATPRTILTAQAATDAINLVFSGDPSTDHVVKYLVLTAAA